LRNQYSLSWSRKRCFLWYPWVHYPVHMSPSLVTILSQVNLVHNLPSSLRSILILSFHLHLGLPSGVIPSAFPTTFCYSLLTCLMPTSCPPQLIVLDLITLIIFDDVHKRETFYDQSPQRPSLSNIKSHDCSVNSQIPTTIMLLLFLTEN
jgi:hypothetical protein